MSGMPGNRSDSRRRFITLAVAASDCPVLIVGGGIVGARKAATLVEQGANVRIVSPELSPRLAELAAAGRVRWIPESYKTAHLADARLVVAATSDDDVNSRIAREAADRGLLICHASSAGESQVIFPALAVVGPATVAVHTGGFAPRLAKRLRDYIAAVLRAHPLLAGKEGDYAGR